MTSTEYQGRGAAGGIAIACAYVQQQRVRDLGAAHPTLSNRAWLTQAIDAARTELAQLATSLDDEESIAVIEFQIAMLEDEALSADAFAAIDAGADVGRAWCEALDEQINDYRASDDAYFAARALDLEDIRDRVLDNLASVEGSEPAVEPDNAYILVAEELTPSRFLEADFSRLVGIALGGGSPLSHVAVLARARAIPMVVGVGEFTPTAGEEVVIDGDRGIVVTAPSAEMRAQYVERMRYLSETRRDQARYLDRAATRADGTLIKVMVNVSHVDELDAVNPAHCDGIGLLRSEFLLDDPAIRSSEDAQYDAYRQFLDWADGKPVTVRTLDAGGDKPIAGVTRDDESNPFLGLRGLRLSLTQAETFDIQCRALARAAVHGDLQVMFPMVTHRAELEQAVGHVDGAIAKLHAAGVACRRPRVGIMLEVPAALIMIDEFEAAEFFSIGSNDLVHYLSATPRDDETLASIAAASEPALWRLISDVCKRLQHDNRPLSLCGDAAADNQRLSAVLDTGLRSLSVSVAALAGTKAWIATH